MGAAQIVRQAGSAEELRRLAEAGFLYAITDASLDPALANWLQEIDPSRAVPLAPEGIQLEFRPYVVALDARLLDWLRQTVWSKSWGVLLSSSADLATLAKHLARFLIVRLPDGEPWFFRYYDPRVLAHYLGTCNHDELAEFAGPIRAFSMTDTEDGSIEELRCVLPETAHVDIERADEAPGWEMRPEHVEAIQAAAAASFDVRAAEHLMQYFPEQCQQLGWSGLQQAIEYGISRAAGHGFVLESNVCVFLDLLFTFGLEFDTQVPWAAEILGDSGLDESQKAERLFQKAAELVQTAMAGDPRAQGAAR